MNIKLYCATRCHKTQHYQAFLNERDLEFEFLDVEENEKMPKNYDLYIPIEN